MSRGFGVLCGERRDRVWKRERERRGTAGGFAVAVVQF